MQRRDLNAPEAYAPVAAYTQAIEVSGAARTLYISGQIGQRMDGSIPDNIVAEPPCVAKSRSAVEGCGHDLGQPRQDHCHSAEPRRCRRCPRGAHQGAWRPQAREHSDRRRPRQPRLEDRDRGHRRRLIGATLTQLQMRQVVECPLLSQSRLCRNVTENAHHRGRLGHEAMPQESIVRMSPSDGQTPYLRRRIQG